MANSKHVDFRQIENLVRSKCYPEDILKDKGKKTNSGNLVRTLESLMCISQVKQGWYWTMIKRELVIS